MDRSNTAQSWCVKRPQCLCLDGLIGPWVVSKTPTLCIPGSALMVSSPQGRFSRHSDDTIFVRCRYRSDKLSVSYDWPAVSWPVELPWPSYTTSWYLPRSTTESEGWNEAKPGSRSDVEVASMITKCHMWSITSKEAGLADFILIDIEASHGKSIVRLGLKGIRCLVNVLL